MEIIKVKFWFRFLCEKEEVHTTCKEALSKYNKTGHLYKLLSKGTQKLCYSKLPCANDVRKTVLKAKKQTKKTPTGEEPA